FALLLGASAVAYTWFTPNTKFSPGAAGTAMAQDATQWTVARQRMVREEVEQAGITDARILDALRATPRHLFVPADQRHLSYFDMALPIGEGQTISPAFVVASMTQSLDPQPTDRVLEIGTGSGYQAAVLSPLVADVYSIEIVPTLARKAAQVLQRLKYDNVHTKTGDGYQGWPEHAPFDKIIVTCSPEKIPQPLVDQLKEGGRIVVPLGERYQQTMYLFRKVEGKMEAESLEPTFFVPMTGRAEEVRQRSDAEGTPDLLNGGFEQSGEDGSLLGWYYVRQAEVVTDGSARGGARFLRFKNETPGRGAQILQAVGVDGRRFREIKVGLDVSLDDVRPGMSQDQLPHVELSFFDERQRPVGTRSIGPWYGTANWVSHEHVVRVPGKAKLCVIMVGLFGATGQMSIDQITVDVVDPATSRRSAR
ncbi:MAG: protein-L-isoaspartate(D-aspartate) O-methyltransferase, partial [Planctomycetales bacterium]|nr:protein-L-isoaspartate(D-aspartate) O-methyltransferase [Planctomycetales bacterium]